jgi:hypothetical protein
VVVLIVVRRRRRTVPVRDTEDSGDSED